MFHSLMCLAPWPACVSPTATAGDNAYFGGIEIIMRTWSGIRCPSSIRLSFCFARSRNTSPDGTSAASIASFCDISKRFSRARGPGIARLAKSNPERREGKASVEARLSPRVLTAKAGGGAKPTTITGNPDMAAVSTSYVERQNLTMRMSMRRFTRLTNGFSKKLENLGHAVALHFMYYNFGRIHQSLRITPAMAAGVTDHAWSLEEIATLVIC